MLTSLVLFSSKDTFSPNLLLRTAVVYAKNYESSQSFLRTQPYQFRNISQNSELKSTTDTFSASTWFVHFDSLCNYLDLFQTQPAANFFKNNCCFPNQEYVEYYINKSTETEFTFSSNIFQGLFNTDFPVGKVFLFIIISSSSGSSGNNSSCNRSGGGSGSGSDSISGCGSSSSKILTWTNKYKLRAIAGARVGKCNLGTRSSKFRSESVNTSWLVNTDLGQGRSIQIGGQGW